MMLSNKPLYKQNIQCLYKYTYYNLEKKLFLEILLLDLRLAREHFFMISYGFRSKLFKIKKNTSFFGSNLFDRGNMRYCHGKSRNIVYINIV